jgi:hypothetical protein
VQYPQPNQPVQYPHPNQPVPPAYGYPYRPPRPNVGQPPPVAVETIPGTPYAVAVVAVAPTTSGPAVASMIAGLGSILVSLVVGCFGALGAKGGWGPAVAGAFALLAIVIGVASVVLGRVGLRQIRRAALLALGAGGVNGRGFAVTGITCGIIGLALTGLAFVVSVIATTA